MTKDVIVAPFKICLIGDSRTGKTSLFSRLSKNEFHLKYEPTNGLELNTHHILVNNKSINTIIWDLPGGEKYCPLADSLYHDAAAILLVYDITDSTSFANITGRLENIIPLANPKTVIKLIGNKRDLEYQRAVPLKKAQKLADDYGISFTETSALDASHVTQSFQWTIQQICSVTNFTSSSLFSTCAFISNSMAKHINIKNQIQDLSFNDSKQEQRPFHVVLIDLNEATKRNIVCVEKPLDDPNLKYVALSYRWGELQERLIDTGLGYTATVISFDLRHLHQVCKLMKQETDLKNMDYVWVDAICVDQTNYERRKATIYQMSTIYERATFILAVPDLHLEHLLKTSTLLGDIVLSSTPHQYYMYSLIHGNLAELDRLDNEFLDNCKVPNDPDLRRFIKSYTDHFTAGFMEYRQHHQYYNSEECLDHIYYESTTTYNNNDSVTKDHRHHRCHLMDCPLDFFDDPNALNSTSNNDDDTRQWKQHIQERSSAIRKSLKLMADLIEDWSTRVWVISEYNIAKKKNNMKYWFTQLNGELGTQVTFFNFDFENASKQTTLNENKSVFATFHRTMLNQLNEQSFFEMMLKSMASKNEDRFYAIFPLTHYKNMVTNKSQVDQWKIDTLSSVKLKLYEIMNTKDKLNLLFLSGSLFVFGLGKILPTFATSSIHWDAPMDQFAIQDMDISLCNFYLSTSITLCHPYLNLKPKEYYTIDHAKLRKNHCFYADRTLWNQLQSEDPYETNSIVCISSRTRTSIQASHTIPWRHYTIVLNGNFKNNIWILEPDTYCYVDDFPSDDKFIHHILDDSSPGFNIY